MHGSQPRTIIGVTAIASGNNKNISLLYGNTIPGNITHQVNAQRIDIP